MIGGARGGFSAGREKKSCRAARLGVYMSHPVDDGESPPGDEAD